MANPIIRIKRGSSAPASLSSGELAIDLTNKNLYIGKADGSVLAIGGEGTFATKSYADAAVSADPLHEPLHGAAHRGHGRGHRRRRCGGVLSRVQRAQWPSLRCGRSGSSPRRHRRARAR